MTEKITQLGNRLARIIASKVFFWCVFGYFLLNALFFVFTALYPMAFDEDFHFGVIQLYANQWSPFLSDNAVTGGSYGAIAHDPSFLFHYLMSFPLKFVRLFTHDVVAQVTVLRLINVALLASALPLYRRLLRRLKASELLTNGTLALFVLVPIVPYLAAHINYDNLLIPLVALTLILALRIAESWRTGDWALRNVFWLALVGLLASIVKYVYLPMFAAVGLFLVWTFFRSVRSRALHGTGFLKQLRSVSRKALVVAGVLFVVAAGLFSQRYVVNVIQYGSPIPACDKVLSQETCSEFGPWGRNNRLKQDKDDSFKPSVSAYVPQWFYGLWLRSFFAVAGVTNNYDTQQPLWLLSRMCIVLAVVGLVTFVLFGWRLLRENRELRLMLLLVVLYCAALFAENYQTYTQTGQPVAVNGRYLLPLLPLIFVLLGKSISAAARSIKASWMIGWAAALVLVIGLTQGGGAATWIVQSKPAWYYAAPAAQHTAAGAKHILTPLVIGPTAGT